MTSSEPIRSPVSSEVTTRRDAPQEAGRLFCEPGTPACDADYDYAARQPYGAGKAVEKISLTGRIKRPLITLHGTLDALLPIDKSSDVYTKMIKKCRHR